jgi:hypothetical protein
MELKHFINDRNRSLWETICKHFKVNIEQHSNDHFYHYFLNDEVYLFVPEQQGMIELFTHEMLHLYLIMGGVNITNYLKSRLRNEPLLHWSFNENLFEQIGECLAHEKMLPLYLSMGFERDLFCENYYVPCCHEMNMQIIRSGMKKEIPSPASIDLFIHKFFAMKCCVNPAFIYDHYLEQLQMINSDLYCILDKFYNEWKAFIIKANEVNSFKRITNDFMHELGTWNIINIYAKQKQRA